MAPIYTHRTRRSFTGTAFRLLSASALLSACPATGDDDSATADDDDATGDDDDNVGDDDDDSATSDWADGGAAAIGGPYPDPFDGDDPDACEVTCSSTLGPCYGETFVRKDISEGEPGLPMRVAIRLVDDQCQPIEGAEVDIWHTNWEGLYSGDDTAAMCTTGDEEALAGQWFRGVQTTDAAGRCDFDSCFPGWYPSRAIHIHFQIRQGGLESLTSQLYFDEKLNNEVLTLHPAYRSRGEAQTNNSEDGILPQENAAKYTFSWGRMDDGVLMVWKTIVVRSNAADPLCAE